MKVIATKVIFNQKTNYFLIASIFAFVVLYIYFANMAVRTVTALENSKSLAEDFRMKVSELEAEYLKMESKISLESALRLGLGQSNQKFIVKKVRGATLSLNSLNKEQ